MPLLQDEANAPVPLASSDAEEPTDAAVRQSIASGRHAEALQLLMTAFGDRLYRFCRANLKDAELTADVHQTVFLKAHECIVRGDVVDDYAAWLYGIARHRCLDALKARRRWYRRFLPAIGREPAGTDPAPDHADAEPMPVETVARGARRLALLDCLSGLAPQVRMCVVMRFQEELTFEAMARICGERASTLQARVARALPVLRECLEDKGWAP